jgi:molybdate transport system substrate-binding protein
MLGKAQRDLGSNWVARFHANIVSKEQDVRAVLSKVELGEADAGIVYTTDVATAKGRVRMVPLPNRYNILAEYPAVLLSTSSAAELAKQFMRFLFEPEAQAILKRHGFGLPIPPKP